MTDLSHPTQNQWRLQFGLETRWSYISAERLRQSEHFHISGDRHLSHCKAFTSSVITIPHAVHDGTEDNFCAFAFEDAGNAADKTVLCLLVVGLFFLVD